MIFCASAFLIAWLGSAYLARPNSFLHHVASPNRRSLHHNPTPTGGGLAIWLGYASALIWAYNTKSASKEALLIFLSAIPLLPVSFLSDRRQLSILGRLFFHFVSASLVLMILGSGLMSGIIRDLPISVPSGFFTVFLALFIVWIINLFNFMDGIDGILGAMCIVGFSTLSYIGWERGDFVFFLTNALVVSGCVGFLLLNFPPAKLFAGDIGSIFLGFMCAAMTLWGIRQNHFSFLTGILIFSPFVYDATITLICRFFGGQKIWEPHKSHYYQRLVNAGWTHRGALGFECTLMVFVSVFSVLSLQRVWLQGIGLVLVGVVFGGLEIYLRSKHK